MSADQVRKVLFISADQWRGECLRPSAIRCVKTPHLDALAADGVLFRNHYSTVCRRAVRRAPACYRAST